MVSTESIIFEEPRESLNVEQRLYGGIDVAGRAVLRPLNASDNGVVRFCSPDVFSDNEFSAGGP